MHTGLAAENDTNVNKLTPQAVQRLLASCSSAENEFDSNFLFYIGVNLTRSSHMKSSSKYKYVIFMQNIILFINNIIISQMGQSWPNG